MTDDKVVGKYFLKLILKRTNCSHVERVGQVLLNDSNFLYRYQIKGGGLQAENRISKTSPNRVKTENGL